MKEATKRAASEAFAQMLAVTAMLVIARTSQGRGAFDSR